MNRKRISDALSGIDMQYIAECESYAPALRKLPADKEHKMGRYENTAKYSRRKLIALVLAACLILGLGITAYATGAIQSLIYGLAPRVPREHLEDMIREHPEDMEFQEILAEQELLEEMGEKAEKRDETVASDSIGASVTLLESCYDGENVSLACRLDKPELPTSFDFDESHPMFAELEEQSFYRPEYGISSCGNQEEAEKAEQILRETGKVGFITQEIYLRDHVYINGEDCGPCHSDVDENGFFVVEPYVYGIGFVELSEASRNQPSVEVTMNLGKATRYHWYADGKYYTCVGEIVDFPVTFTVRNTNE